MTRTQKRKLISAGLVAFTFLLLTVIGVVYYIVRTAHLSHRGHMIYMLGTMVWLIVYLTAIFIINRKKKVVLTPEERIQTLPSHLNLNNRFEWRLFLLSIAIFLYSILILCFSYIIKGDRFSMIYWGSFGIVGIVAYVAIFASLRRNEYLIEGNTLIVREYKFKHLDTDLRIPMKTIEQVYLKNHYTLFPRVILEIEGNQRELRCISHPEELAIAIQQVVTFVGDRQQ